MRFSWLHVATASLIVLAVLTSHVALGISIPGDWALTVWAVSQRDEAFTQVIWLLTFITSATPALFICLAACVLEFVRLRRARQSRHPYGCGSLPDP